MLLFEIEFLRKEVADFPKWKMLAFSLSICERLYPNFARFCDEFSFSGKEFLRECLDCAWNYLESGEFRGDSRLMAQKCVALAPDTEEYQTILVSSALDAAISISNTLSFISIPKLDLVLEVASLAYDSVDMYVQEAEDMHPSDSNLEEKILAHPIVQSELKRQRDAILYLRDLDRDVSSAITEIKRLWFQNQNGSLEIDA